MAILWLFARRNLKFVGKRGVFVGVVLLPDGWFVETGMLSDCAGYSRC
jgi:hypothetical protein